GDVGTGKTTLCRCLLDRLEKNIQVALVLNPLLSDMDLLRACVHDLRVQPLYGPREKPILAGGGKIKELRGTRHDDVQDHDPRWIHSASKTELLEALNAFLLQQHENGGSTVVIIDEAQNLSLEVMEQLRILSNLETEKEKLLQIIFVGQLELNDKLKLPDLKQLNQRISIRYEISPLSREETKSYISHRILVAGAGSRIAFTRSSLNEIYNYSKGYPRLINMVCDRALLAGYNDQADTIDARQVKQAVRSLLGAEEKSYFVEQFLKPRVSLFASVFFFAAGLVFFLFSENGFFRTAGDAWRLPGQTPAINASPSAGVSPAKEPVPPAKSAPVEKAAVLEPGPVEAPSSVSDATAARDAQSAPNVVEEKNLAQEKIIEPPISPVPAHERETYRIQIDSLSAETPANDSVLRLQKEGFNAYWKKVNAGGKSAYVVYVGPFDDINAAKIHFNALRQTGRNPMLFSVSKSG
ncbi:MAG: AAA family ATPase, partial [Nitrospinae bacterium]|nr:AAA family ATPase [Nitrospinota bacterium]